MPAAGTVSSFYAVVGTAPGSSQSYTFTVRKNGVDTGVTCAIAATATTCSDLANSVSFAAGDMISIKVVGTSGAADNLEPRWTAKYVTP